MKSKSRLCLCYVLNYFAGEGSHSFQEDKPKETFCIKLFTDSFVVSSISCSTRFESTSFLISVIWIRFGYKEAVMI